MDMNIENVVREWAWQVSNGMPDPKNRIHVNILRDILINEGFPVEFVTAYLNELSSVTDGFSHLGNGIYVKKGDEKNKNANKFKKNPAGTKLVPVDSKDTTAQNGQSADDQSATDSAPSAQDSAPPEEPAPIPNPAKLSKDNFKIDGEKPEKKPGSKKSSKKKSTSKNTESRQKSIESGFVEGTAAPGNAGSMYNELMSGQAADMFRSNPDATDTEIVEKILKKYKGTELADQNTGRTIVGGVLKSELPVNTGTSDNGLVSKTLIAVRSGRRKFEKSRDIAKNLNWKNPDVTEFWGDKSGLKQQEKDINSLKKLVDSEGNEISKSDIVQLIKESGGSSNPSDTATIIEDKDTGNGTILFHSDKDSTAAIVANSTPSKESDNTENVLNKMTTDGIISRSASSEYFKQRKEFDTKRQTIEDRLKTITTSPAKFFVDGIKSGNIPMGELIDAMKSSGGGTDSNKRWNKSVVLKFSDPKRAIKLPLRASDFLPDGYNDPPSDEDMATAFFKMMSDSDNPSIFDQRTIDKVGKKLGAPDVNQSVSAIREETIANERSMIDALNMNKAKVGDQEIGIANLTEGENIWDKGHFAAITRDEGVHKYPNMFEVNHGGLVVDGDVLQKSIGIRTKNEYLQGFTIGESMNQLDKDANITGSTSFVYAVVTTREGITRSVPIMEKKLRSKGGPLGKLETVYKWSKEMKSSFKEQHKNRTS